VVGGGLSPTANPAASATTVAQAVPPHAAPRSLAIRALSRGKGVPGPTRAAFARIRELAERARKDGRVTSLESRRIGIEGETRLCMTFRDAAAARVLAREVRAIAKNVELLNVAQEPCRSEEKKP
jgi:hypothetical protein